MAPSHSTDFKYTVHKERNNKKKQKGKVTFVDMYIFRDKAANKFLSSGFTSIELKSSVDPIHFLVKWVGVVAVCCKKQVSVYLDFKYSKSEAGENPEEPVAPSQQ